MFTGSGRYLPLRQVFAGSDSRLPAQIGISKAHSDRQSKSVLWCTCFWVDGLGVCGVRIVPAAARGWFLELVLVWWRSGSFLGMVFELLLPGS